MLVYSYKVTAARVVSQDGLQNVVREVDVIVKGVDGPAKFELPTTAKFGDADPDNFTPFEQLTEEQLSSWLQDEPSLVGIREHIALVVGRELARLGMEQKPMPWAPVPEPDAVVDPVVAGD